MNKLIVIIFGVLIVGSVGFLVLNNTEQDEAVINQPTVNNNEADASSHNDSKNSTNTSQKPGQYIDYSEEQFVATASTKRVLFFHAAWCSVCQFYESEIETEGVPDGVTILKIDYDTSDELKQKYDVSVQSTFIQLDSEGGVVNKWPYASGLSNIKDLYSKL